MSNAGDENLNPESSQIATQFYQVNAKTLHTKLGTTGFQFDLIPDQDFISRPKFANWL